MSLFLPLKSVYQVIKIITLFKSQGYLAEYECSNWETINYSLKSEQIKLNQMLVFEERGKLEYPEKNLSEQSRAPTNSAHIGHPIRESIPGHISGR